MFKRMMLAFLKLFVSNKIYGVKKTKTFNFKKL